MGEFHYIPPRGNDTRHRAARTPVAREASPRETATATPASVAVESPLVLPKQRLKNIEPVFQLDAVMYVTFQDRIYAVPPVPYRLGQRLLDLHVRVVSTMREIATSGSKEKTTEFYRLLSLVSRLLWAHMQPTPRWRRVLRRMGGLRNPLKHATEQDLLRLTDFFLKCRMKSSVHVMSGLGETDVIQSLTS